MSDLSLAIGVLERAVLERDAVLAGSVLDPGFAAVQVEPAVSVVERDDFLAALREGAVAGHEVLERFVHEDGDTAAVLQQVRTGRAADPADPDADGAGLATVTDVWRQRADGWRLWRRHRTPSRDELGAAADERRASRAAGIGSAPAPDAGPESATDSTTRATVAEVAAVLAAIADAGQDPAQLSPADMEEYVEAFRALKHQSDDA